MRSARWMWFFALVFWWSLSGCVTGKALYLPGGLSRPPAAGPAAAAPGGPSVAVLDFTWAGSRSPEIGRDYDQVRPIVWKGAPGRSMADLIARALEEKGIPVVRVSGESEAPPGVPARVWGRVDEFRVNVKRQGSVKVEAEAYVALTIYGAGPSAPPGWRSVATSNFWYTDPLFITPEGVLRSVNSAANAVAEEAVRRLMEAGIVATPTKGFIGREGTERKP
ncbi:MAG: hypothetical protein HZA60_08030 [Deltaproteobacteria bacterium]|nr:hypothetical protein [Deltaproteobacteria bacterium]